MPTAALRPCRVCKRVGCTTHRKLDWDHAHPRQRIRGRRLQRLRAQLFLEHPFCEVCLRRLSTLRDHRVPLFQGGTEDPANIQALCQTCSDLKTAKESQEGRDLTR